jgi:hypothetical protein
MRRLDQELQQKELRQEMKKQLCRLQEQQQLQKIRPSIVIGDAIPYTFTKQIIPTPSPLTPNSTDELLPSVEEASEEVSHQFSTIFPSILQFADSSFLFSAFWRKSIRKRFTDPFFVTDINGKAFIIMTLNKSFSIDGKFFN